MNRTHTKIILGLSIIGLCSLSSCSKSSKPKKTADTTNNDAIQQPINPINDGYNQGFNSIEITETSTAGTQLNVIQGQTHTWTFIARMTNGIGTANITQINATPQPSGMSVSGTTVTFRPTNTNDLNGQITVVAQGNDGTTEQQIFIWGNGTGTGLNNGITGQNGVIGILSGILPSLLGSNSGTTGGLGSILNSLFGGLTNNN